MLMAIIAALNIPFNDCQPQYMFTMLFKYGLIEKYEFYAKYIKRLAMRWDEKQQKNEEKTKTAPVTQR